MQLFQNAVKRIDSGRIRKEYIGTMKKDWLIRNRIPDQPIFLAVSLLFQTGNVRLR